MIWALWVLIAALPSIAQATTYYADPAGGAAASCVDDGANVCTLDRAITVSSAGDTVMLASGTYDYATSGLSLQKNITLDAAVDYGPVITGTHATRVLSLFPANNATPMIVKKLRVTNGGTTANTVQIGAPGYAVNVYIQGTSVQAGTNSGILDASTAGVSWITNCVIDGTAGSASGSSGITSTPTITAAKIVIVDGCTLSHVPSSTGTTYGIFMSRPAGSTQQLFSYIANNTITMTAAPALGAGVYLVGIATQRITTAPNLSSVLTDPIIEGNTVTLTATAATTNGVTAIGVGSTDATATGDNAVIRDNTILIDSPVSGGITNNFTTGQNYAANVRVYRNDVRGTFYNGTATPHGISCNFSTSCHVYRNRVRGFAVGVILSLGTTHYAYGNLIEGAYYAPLFAKGNTSAFFAHNTVVMDDTLYGAKFGGYGCLGVAVQGATNNAATTFQNNNCYVRSGAGWDYVVVDASQVATFDANNYYSAVALSGNTWSYQGSATDTLSTWNANATVGTDLNAEPLFVGDDDYRLNSGSSLRRAGAGGSLCLDYRGRVCYPDRPDIGAYQSTSGDPAATRAVRN